MKCLPTSRRYSISDSLPSQSRLFASTAWVGPGEKSRNRSSWTRIDATLCSIVAASSRFRSDDRPDGSPIIPVPPPTSATGRPPCRWKRISPKIGTRWPTWSESPERVESDVGGDRPARRQALRQARRGRVEDPPPLEVREQPAEPGRVAAGGRIAHLDVTGCGPEPSLVRPVRLDRASIPCMVSSRPSCKPASGGSVVAGSVTAAAPAGTVRTRPRPSPSRSPSSCSWSSPCSAWPVPARPSPRTRTCREDLADPKQALGRPRLHPADDACTTAAGEVQLAQARRRPPRGRDLRGHPARPHRRDDLDRGQDVLGELGLRPGRLRRGRDRHHPGPRPRRLDDHPAARPRAPASRRARSSGSVYERKAKEIIQSIRLTEAYPGEAGKQRSSRSTSTRTSTATAATASRRRRGATGTRTSRT